MNEKKKTIILKITNSGIFFNDKDCIGWSNTNFPSKSHFNINERAGIYWEAEMVSFNKMSSRLNVKIINYRAIRNDENFATQKPKYEIKEIGFDKLQWAELEQILNFYVKAQFVSITDASEIRDKSNTKATRVGEPDFSPSSYALIAFSMELDFEFPLKKTQFKMGFVELEKKIKGREVTIKIFNDNIIPEFDHVKPYFARALGQRKIRVTGKMDIDVNGRVRSKCRSREIDQINQELISIVRKLDLRNMILKNMELDTDKSLFTPEEYFDHCADRSLGKMGRKEDTNLMAEILEIEEIRNKKQLHYLSGKLQSKDAGLRFTLSPKFGFLFYVKGERMDHFILELLNDHATYIWSISNRGISLESKFRTIELQIEKIRELGRRKYMVSPIQEDLLFQRLNHADSTSNFIDGFPKWKARLEEKLV